MQSPLPSPDPENMTPEDREAFRREREKALILQQRSTACYLYGIVSKSLGNTFPVWTCQLYLDSVLEEAGNPKDPIERMMVEQLALAHHNLGRLYLQAAHATTPEQAEVYNTAAARLLSEFRRLALALREYRTPSTPKEVTMIGQQNVANGSQPIASVENASLSASRKKSRNGRLKHKTSEKSEHEHCQDLIPQSTPRRRRKKELVETWALDTRCSRAAAASGNGKPAVGVFDGPEDA